MSGATEPGAIRFDSYMTLRWSCRRGDLLLWMRFANVFAGPQTLRILDLWRMRDGDLVTITNRVEDLPAWFELHPTEVRNSLVPGMMAKLEAGYKPGDPVDGPNIWRLNSGDRVAWVGSERPNQHAADGLLAILDCRKCALASGDSNWSDLGEFLAFGAMSEPMSSEDDSRCKGAMKAVQRLGTPRTWGTGWALG